MDKKNIGSSFDDFLKEQGIYDEVTKSAKEKLLKKDYIFPFRMDQPFKKLLKGACKKAGHNMSQFIRVAVLEKIKRDK